MNKSDQQLEKYDVVARMFELVNNLSEDQQIILLKQLVKDSVVTQLGKLIVDMPKDQQLILLKQIEGMTLEGKRDHSRKSCLISVDYVVEGRAFTNYIQNLSSGGVFIETSESFSLGQEITMAFSFSNDHRPSKFTGEIVRIKKNGIGVKFKDLTKYQEEIIKSAAQKMKGL